MRCPTTNIKQYMQLHGLRCQATNQTAAANAHARVEASAAAHPRHNTRWNARQECGIAALGCRDITPMDIAPVALRSAEPG